MATCRECLYSLVCRHAGKMSEDSFSCTNYKPKSDYVKRERGEWISVEDRLPDDGQMALCFLKNNKIVVLQWEERNSCWIDNYREYFIVTHWQPLPEPPELLKGGVVNE